MGVFWLPESEGVFCMGTTDEGEDEDDACAMFVPRTSGMTDSLGMFAFWAIRGSGGAAAAGLTKDDEDR